MKWLNFMPLLIWALGFLALYAWSEHLSVMDGRGEFEDLAVEGALILWVMGDIVFIIIGLLLTIRN